MNQLIRVACSYNRRHQKVKFQCCLQFFWHWHLEWFDSTTLHKYGMMCKSYRGIRTVIWYFYFTNVHYFNLALPWLPKLISLSVNYDCDFINDWLKFHIYPIIGAD